MRALLLVAATCSAALLSGCGGEDSTSGDVVQVPGGDSAAPSPTPSGETALAPGIPIEVPATGPVRLEPIQRREMTGLGIEGRVCGFSDQFGAIPVFAAGGPAQAGVIRVAGTLISLQPSGSVGAAGGRFSGGGYSVDVRANPQGSVPNAPEGVVPARLSLTRPDGGTQDYAAGVYACTG